MKLILFKKPVVVFNVFDKYIDADTFLDTFTVEQSKDSRKLEREAKLALERAKRGGKVVELKIPGEASHKWYLRDNKYYRWYKSLEYKYFKRKYGIKDVPALILESDKTYKVLGKDATAEKILNEIEKIYEIN
ncbi:MAG: hypothetical protein ACE5K4_05985 [Candidatus Hydrothermarchaeota archaeon]